MTAPTVHPCLTDCVHGICAWPGSTQGCGGCCGCLGPCVIDWEDATCVEQGHPRPEYAPMSKYGPAPDDDGETIVRGTD